MTVAVQEFDQVAQRGREGFRERLGAWVAAQEGTFFLWSPLILIAGIWTYFALPAEPPLVVFAILLIGIPLLLVAIRRRGALLLKILCLALIGFGLAKLRTEWVAAPAVPAPTGEVVLSGIVEQIDSRGPRRSIVVLHVTGLEGEGIIRKPERVRLNVSGQFPDVQPGTILRAKARLFPLPTPAMPGSYDYGRSLWFDGIGATGRLFGGIEVMGRDQSWLLRIKAALHDLRTAIGQRIRAVLPPERSGFAEALITGERGAIPREINDSLQTSGLAHILSISGLHMSLVAGGFFWLVRAMLALSPFLVIHYPIKKWAALAGLFIGFAYMLLAGASVATQRSYIMLAVMFIAILVDRPALTMRNLAIAALIILVIFPEAALTASLQMSFLAVMGLLAFHEVWGKWFAEGDGPSPGVLRRGATMIMRAILAMAFTTLAAGCLSSIAAAYHFGRLAPYSLIANLLALPAVSVIVMPMALLSVLLMPFGLESLPLLVMNEGLALIEAISNGVSGLPQAQGLIPALPLVSSLLLTLAATLLCLLRGPLRLVALPVACAAILSAGLGKYPDILIERTAANVALRNGTGELAFAHPRRGRFAAGIWLRETGDGATLAEAARRPGWTCEKNVCRAAVNGKRIVYLREDKLSLSLPCAEADILIADFPLRGRCRSVALRIDRFDVWRSGAQALYVSRDETTVATARALRGNRPWVVAPEPRRKDTSRNAARPGMKTGHDAKARPRS